MKTLKYLLAGFILANFVYAQEGDGNFPPPDDPIEIKAIRSTAPIRIDGVLDEADWEHAIPITNFFRMEPRQGGEFKYKTSVRVLFDDKNLYVGAFCEDSLGRKGVRVQDLRRDFLWDQNDIFGIQLDPQNLKQFAVSFQTTPYGNQRDLQNFNDQITDNDWNAIWTVRTTRTDSGFIAEFAIPFKSLRYDEVPEGQAVEWGVTFYRLARREFELTVFPAIPQSFSPFRMSYAAKLTGLKLPPASANIRAESYTLFQNEELTTEERSTSQSDLKVGGDIKWAVNPSTVIDFTFNTDFAQADVDRAVNNLERFNIFFPERRQFFLENSGIWAGGRQTSIRPFFSRRIGLQGNFNAAPARIDAGTRFTVRDEKKAIAGLYMHQAETQNSAAASFGVARYLRNYGRENNIGMMVTHRLNEASSALDLSTQNNSTITLDGLIRPSSIWSVVYLASGSIDHEENQTGFAGRLFVGRSANNSYWGWVTEATSDNYNPAMGFVRQRNVIRHNPGGYWIVRPKQLPWVRRWDPGFFIDYYHDASDPGKFQQANIWLFPIWTYFTDGSFVAYSIFPTWQNINFNFAPLGVQIAEDDYYYTRHRVRFNTDQSQIWSLTGTLEWGTFYNGDRTTISSGLRLAPSVKAAFTADFEYNGLRDLGLNSEDLDTRLITLGGRFAANPRTQISAFYQHNSFDDSGRWNVRFSWEYRPLSFIYLVFNDGRFEDSNSSIAEQQLVTKLTFIKQF